MSRGAQDLETRERSLDAPGLSYRIPMPESSPLVGYKRPTSWFPSKREGVRSCAGSVEQLLALNQHLENADRQPPISYA